MEEEAQPDLDALSLRVASPATRPKSEADALDRWLDLEYGPEPDELRGFRRLALAILNDALTRCRKGNRLDAMWLTDTETVLVWLGIAGVKGISATRIASYLARIGRETLCRDTHNQENRK